MSWVKVEIETKFHPQDFVKFDDEGMIMTTKYDELKECIIDIIDINEMSLQEDFHNNRELFTIQENFPTSWKWEKNFFVKKNWVEGEKKFDEVEKLMH